MLPPIIQKGIEKAASKAIEHGSKIVVAVVTATGVFIGEEWSKAKAKVKARREGEAYGYKKGYDTAKREDQNEINRSREFLTKILKRKKK